MDDVVNELFANFYVSPVWELTMAWTITALDSADRSSLTVEQIRDVQITLGILN